MDDLASYQLTKPSASASPPANSENRWQCLPRRAHFQDLESLRRWEPERAETVLGLLPVPLPLPAHSTKLLANGPALSRLEASSGGLQEKSRLSGLRAGSCRAAELESCRTENHGPVVRPRCAHLKDRRRTVRHRDITLLTSCGHTSTHLARLSNPHSRCARHRRATACPRFPPLRLLGRLPFGHYRPRDWIFPREHATRESCLRIGGA
jgi:hypothetical protein